MSKKYIAQVLLEVELNAETANGASFELEYLEINIRGHHPTETKSFKIINTHIITEPSDEEFLDRFGKPDFRPY